MPLGAVLARIRAVRLRPILAVLLLLASGTQAFAASRDAECARHDGARQDAVVAAAMEVEKVKKATEGMQIVKTILVKNKLVNLIVKPAK